ncbi:uncharacterized protein LOC119995523 [Tripterygium wilfordii]|uniref:uncharacterized protein LOC119995523 n=1 Tax=Tripterygium wilfordii TaxID=458696 RepID=UPI0018F81676|nr:uncharacterized protein LOC119995523 [Tripterygium wilfordii]
MMFNCLVWNIRGVGNSPSLRRLKSLCFLNKIQIVSILEPMIPEERLKVIAKRLKMNNYASNISGKIWICWKDYIPLRIFSNHDLILTLESDPSWGSILISTVYAKCSRVERLPSWNDIQTISSLRRPWCVGGDFNVVLSRLEKRGLTGINRGSSNDFFHCMQNSNLFDSGFSGSSFTWTNRRCWARLDRMCVNSEWQNKFASTLVSHLPRTNSDHSPLLVKIVDHHHNGPKPFRFLNVRFSHKDFNSVVKASWDLPIHGQPIQRLYAKLKRLKNNLNNWNKISFGNIFQRVIDAEKELAASQSPFDSNPSDAYKLELQTKSANLTSVLLQEEAYWKQKAKVKWCKEGDANTKFFHASWVSGEELGKNLVTFFQCQLSQIEVPDRVITEDFISHIPQIVTQGDKILLDNLPYPNEVKNVVFSIDADSCSGPDGFNGHFFQSCWNIIESDLVEACKAFWNGQNLPKSCTSTLIVLIPKVVNPTKFSDLRPISLCNLVNKIISKIMAIRLLPNIISSNQSAFVKGGDISDNVLLAQELLAHLNKKVRGNNVLIKLDMAKAYDRVSWPFLTQMFRKLGFSEGWIDLVWNLISNNWFSILFNGNSLGYLKSGRGLRQGDPLSPALFIIMTESLSRNLNNLYLLNAAFSYQTGRRMDIISHLAYADDILLFSNGSRKAFEGLLKVLSRYEHCSSTLRLMELTSFNKKKLSITYLGCPLSIERKRVNLYDNLVDKFKSQVANWSTSLLSVGGRLILLKHVLSSFCIYMFAVLSPPKKILHEINSICANFFWGKTEFGNRFHWVAWRKITRPKAKGGLDIRDISEMVVAQSCYITWKRMCSVRQVMEKNIKVIIGQGKVHMWRDNWLRDGPLQLIPDFIVEKILTEIPSIYDCPGKMIWMPNQNGNFTVKSAWHVTRQSNIFNPVYDYIWHDLIPITISIFMWKVLNNKLHVDENIKKKGISLVSKCDCCTNFPHVETVEHVLVEGFEQTHLTGGQIIEEIIDQIRVQFQCKAKTSNMELRDLNVSKLFCIPMRANSKGKVSILYWNPPPHNVTIINCDGSALNNPGDSGGGGVIRRSSGIFVAVFSNFYGSNSITFAEMMAIHEGINLVASLGLSNLPVESDSLIVINILSERSSINGAADFLGSKASNSKVSVAYDRFCNLPPTVKGSRVSLLNRIILALARKFSLKDSGDEYKF